jgi:hypothetical protein
MELTLERDEAPPAGAVVDRELANRAHRGFPAAVF